MVQRFVSDWKARDTGHRVWPWPLLGAVMVGLGSGLLSVTPIGQHLEQQVGLSALLSLRGKIDPPQEVVVIAMRRDTGERLSLPRQRSATAPCADLRVDETPPTHRPLGDVPERWGRCHHVELLRRLAWAKPSVVAFDVTFRPRNDLGRDEDRALAQAIRALGNVVLVQRLKIAQRGGETFDMPVQLSPDLTDSALGLAPMPFPILVPDRFDEFWTFKDSGFMAATLPGLALQVHALDVYPALLRVMRRAFPKAVSEFPDSAATLTSDGSLHAHVLHLRAIFRQFPDRATQVSSATDEVAKSLAVSQQRRLRAAVSFYAGNSQRYLNVYGPPEAIPTLSMTEVLARRPTRDSPDPLGLRDKVVFVGFADDEDWEPLEKFATAFNAGGRRLSGVEIAATAFANLLDGISLQSMPLLMRAALAFGVGFGAALLLYVATGTRGALVCLTGLAIYMGVTLLLFTRLQLWAPVFIPVLIAIPAGAAFAFGRKFVDVKQDRDALQAIMRQFVPPDVVSTLMANANRLGAVKDTTQAACVMTDVEGYTDLSSRFTAGQIDALLPEYFAALFEPVARHGGFVSDLKGDSILAIWADRDAGLPLRSKVCGACLDLKEAVDRFNAEHPDTPMLTRIGVSYGVVTLGAVGAHSHYEYRAVGDTVNTASRVEQLAKDLGSYLLVTGELVAGLDGFLLRDLGSFKLRGRRTVTRIFELIARMDNAATHQRKLCADFAEALAAYEGQRAEDARTRFQSVLQQFPRDGPSEYYLRLVETT